MKLLVQAIRKKIDRVCFRFSKYLRYFGIIPLTMISPLFLITFFHFSHKLINILEAWRSWNFHFRASETTFQCLRTPKPIIIGNIKIAETLIKKNGDDPENVNILLLKVMKIVKLSIMPTFSFSSNGNCYVAEILSKLSNWGSLKLKKKNKFSCNLFSEQ